MKVKFTKHIGGGIYVGLSKDGDVVLTNNNIVIHMDTDGIIRLMSWLETLPEKMKQEKLV